MRVAVDKLFQNKMKNPVAQTKIRKMKNLVWLLFATGFFCFLIFGTRFLDDISLIDATSLVRIRDGAVEKRAFLQYLCVSHLILLVLCGFFWWYQWGKAWIYVWIGYGAFKLGVCLAVALVRYQLKGIVLWFVLYLPHTIFYFLALVCGVRLCQKMGSKNTEKVRFLLRNIIWVLGVLVSWGVGIYLECYVSSVLLQNYLQHF